MKKLLFFSLIFIFGSSHAQKIRVTVKPDSATFSANGEFLRSPYKIKEDDPTWVYVVWKKGYVNHGFTHTDIAQNGIADYSIELEKIKHLPVGYASKVIDVYKMVDKTGRLPAGIFGDPLFFKKALSERLYSFGYTHVTNVDLFDRQTEYVQLKLVGEVVEFSKNTTGGYFQVSIIVNWSVYDVAQDKVVFQCRSAGYSNTEIPFPKELSLALKNALMGLMSNTAFQQLALNLN
jgi:hypothetical protein